MLFSFFRSVKRRALAKIAANHIAQAINEASGRFFLRDDRREFYMRVLEDEFVLSYLYGAISFSIVLMGVREEESMGYILCEVYERLFPGYGRSALDVCNTRVEEGNESFKSGSNAGYAEMKGMWDSPGVGLLWSLQNHLLDLQGRVP